MFLSPVFREAFVNTIGAPLELYNTDGATGAAIGAGLGAGIFDSVNEAFTGLTVKKFAAPEQKKRELYQGAYLKWLALLDHGK
jgi:xylulokinase